MELNKLEDGLENDLFKEINKIPIIDVHSHIDKDKPVAKNLAEILGYHYYTELAASSGFNKNNLILPPQNIVEKLVEYFPYLTNTIQYDWLIHLSKIFFEFKNDNLTCDNWQILYDKVEKFGNDKNFKEEVIKKSNIEKVVLTNNFYETKDNFNDTRFVFSLRADDLIFKIQNKEIREKLEQKTKITICNLTDFEKAIDTIFEYFKSYDACSVAIGIPPNFIAKEVKKEDVENEFNNLLKTNSTVPNLQSYIMNKIMENCTIYSFPVQLMIGAEKEIYKHGVYLGQDLFSSNFCLKNCLYLFNQYSKINFLISVLPYSLSHEQTAYGWLIHNVFPSGHWWYANLPNYIEQVLTLRLQSVPYNKLIGYYSDAYKLEFILPKFYMYKKILAKVLAKRCVENNFYVSPFSEDDAIKIAKILLYDNPKQLLNL